MSLTLYPFKIEANGPNDEKTIDKAIADMLNDVAVYFDTPDYEEKEPPWPNCTFGADHIISLVGHGCIWGYNTSHNPKAILADSGGGHDFAVIGEYLVDEWAADYFPDENPTGRLHLIADYSTIKRLYGEPFMWEQTNF